MEASYLIFDCPASIFVWLGLLFLYIRSVPSRVKPLPDSKKYRTFSSPSMAEMELLSIPASQNSWHLYGIMDVIRGIRP